MTLSKIEAMLSQTHARRLVILGDLLHARSSATDVVLESLDCFFSRFADGDVWLTLGNHDRHVNRILERWPIIAKSEFSIENVRFGHFPLEDVESQNSAPSSPIGIQVDSGQSTAAELRICGHLHPAIRLADATDQLPKLPCFWLRGNQLVLPALGDFTGTHAIRARRNDRVWVLAENEVIEVTGRYSSLSN